MDRQATFDGMKKIWRFMAKIASELKKALTNPQAKELFHNLQVAGDRMNKWDPVGQLPDFNRSIFETENKKEVKYDGKVK